MERERLPLAGLVGSSPEEVRRSLGEPAVDRAVGRERWLVYRTEGITLRVRCRPGSGQGDGGRVASWTATFSRGRRSLREAAEALGLWPACAPDGDAGTARGGLLLRALPSPSGDAVRSLTATVRGGLVRQLTVFDEPPEWAGTGGAVGDAGETVGDAGGAVGDAGGTAPDGGGR